MHDPAAVRFIQRIRNLRPVPQYLLQRQGPFFEALRQRLAFDALHHQIIDPVLMPDVIQHADVADDSGWRWFSLRARIAACGRDRRKLRRQNLYRHDAVQPRVPRAIHLAHPARAERCDDFVRAKFGAWSERHDWP